MASQEIKKKSVRRQVKSVWPKPLKKYEKLELTRTYLWEVRYQQILGGTVIPKMHGCSYKTFMNGKPHSFKGTEVKFANVHVRGTCSDLVERKMFRLWTAILIRSPGQRESMMTTEYCPATEIQRMEQELWTLTLKGDDIEAYNNRFHELALMCHELVPTEKKKIERIFWVFLKEFKGNITSSKPATIA
ncbi:hypothetical protein Tco_1266393 [Tanacetum coccineum]